jgi:signal transduction histidine kinase
VANKDALTLWEAQFGDFVNGAQIIIDQYIVAAEDKWGQTSGLVMLLPHGYEGQGPEHSSARIERFLQQAAEDNIQIVVATTAAQYFHLLRRQMHRDIRKPLILFTPKSPLRMKESHSSVAALTSGSFQEVLDDPFVTDRDAVRRLVFCTGKVAWDAFSARAERSAAAAMERARIARELHDGVIQAVTGVEIQVAALSLRLANESPSVASELRRLKMILREEVVSLRELMHQMKPLELGPHQLVDALEDSVQRFQRETGISARFVTQLDRIALTPRACREVAQILHEALVNVRRHSGARNVFVRLTAVNGDCRLSIDDDGCGFPFAGRFSQADLEATRKGPLVIKERVRLLGGELTIESDPGRGARLEIAVPIATHGIHR